MEELLLIIVIAAVAVGAVLYWLSKRPKKPPTPSRLNVKVEPAEVIADGKSSSTITVELMDKKGKPADAQSEVQVTLSATSGRLPSPIVRIPRGRNSGTAVLVSSTEFGTLSISAEATGLEGGTARMTFKEKPRFCMGCGTRMSVKDTVCQKCGASPSHFGGLETKTCHCGTVLPFTASFCTECGAKQQPAKAG
jgi:NADH pyrophosphatase NudC (nudix superfamily)